MTEAKTPDINNQFPGDESLYLVAIGDKKSGNI